MAETQLDEELSGSQVDDLKAFLAALQGQFPIITLPRLPSIPGESVINGAKEISESTSE
jgi:cytochrome c peroxidase